MRRRGIGIAVAAYVLGVVLIALLVVAPFLDKKRDILAAVPSPPALTVVDLVKVPGGSRLCMGNLAISAESRQMRFRVGTYGKPGPQLGVTITAPGYAVNASVAPGWADNTEQSVPIPPAPGSQLARVCIRNGGKRLVAFYAASDRSRSRVQTTVDGKGELATPTLSFAEAHPVSLVQHAGVVAGRIAVFRGFLDHAWVVWALALAMLIGVPVLAGVGLAAGERQPRSDSSAE